ncbi:methyl-CpG-binding domain protein 4 [Carex littledalei]|uniref:Methyl-CpG-binding domain protein 4 n=1 Tax=Carex littledalei TaxID=544730 RepID=A0A833R0Q9_9POAL|nr:methyl-CpG-binding domain protein 4 [Carex littledalei]
MARSSPVLFFVDTSLDTHLAIAVSPHDTVASLKNVCFGGPTEVVNTSLKKKKRKRNIASFEDTTTLRPTQSRKVGEEEFQGKGIFDLLDSFCYTGTGRRRRGGGPCWIPSLSVISKRKPTPPSTPSPLKRTRPTAFAFAAENTAPAPVGTDNVKKVRKSHNPPKGNAAVAAGVLAPPETMTVTVTVKKKKKKTSSQLRAAAKRSEAYRRVPHDFDFKPPRSCHRLIQEDHTFDHWRVLVICMLLNMTTGKQVKKVVEDFFVLCTDAETTTKVDTKQIQNVISTLGLHNKRAHMIKRLSEEYLRPDWTHVTSLHGIGKYAADAYAIFCTGKGADVRPQDHMLVHYWNSIYGKGIRSDAPV